MASTDDVVERCIFYVTPDKKRKLRALLAARGTTLIDFFTGLVDETLDDNSTIFELFKKKKGKEKSS